MVVPIMKSKSCSARGRLFHRIVHLPSSMIIKGYWYPCSFYITGGGCLVTCDIFPFIWLACIGMKHPKMTIVTGLKTSATWRNNMVSNDITTSGTSINIYEYLQMSYVPFTTCYITYPTMTCSSKIILVHQLNAT